MAGRHPKAMRSRDERAHPVVQAALDGGYLDTGAEYPVTGFADHEVANQGRLSINRAARHLGVSVAAWVIDHADGTASVRFRLHSKNKARQHVLTQSGGDPGKLKYNPFQRGQGPVVDDDGRRLNAD